MHQVLAALGLTGASVLVHVAGFLIVLRYLDLVRQHKPALHGRFYVIRLVVEVTLWIVVLHLTEVALWAAFLLWVGACPDAATALYFSLGSYSTVGTHELSLPHQWRMLRGFEALAGALMFGLSTAFIFSIINAVLQISHNHEYQKGI